MKEHGLRHWWDFLKSVAYDAAPSPLQSLSTAPWSQQRNFIPRIFYYFAGLEDDEKPSDDCTEMLIWYTVFASSMLLLNKLTMQLVVEPYLVLFIQTGSASSIILGMHFLSLVKIRLFPSHATAFAWFLVANGFLLSVWTSLKTLKYNQVAWYMVLHYSQPAAMCVLDWLVLKHRRPTLRSVLYLLLLPLISAAWMWWSTGNAFTLSVNVQFPLAHFLFMNRITRSISPKMRRKTSAVPPNPPNAELQGAANTEATEDFEEADREEGPTKKAEPQKTLSQDHERLSELLEQMQYLNSEVKAVVSNKDAVLETARRSATQNWKNERVFFK
ncbi:hypothetical protein CYMTET_50433 [Cymbomonas tetramitiformis]|uniref:Uncharacterized protein n=1 Tax=Cymbomonas tetramitiformis TaxID=36881 RepID=A0AAE0ESU4_9CHLO|nr:hypothetical protein CYMTET_50433 [Cymbomonas tetramitiformis]